MRISTHTRARALVCTCVCVRASMQSSVRLTVRYMLHKMSENRPKRNYLTGPLLKKFLKSEPASRASAADRQNVDFLPPEGGEGKRGARNMAPAGIKNGAGRETVSIKRKLSLARRRSDAASRSDVDSRNTTRRTRPTRETTAEASGTVLTGRGGADLRGWNARERERKV